MSPFEQLTFGSIVHNGTPIRTDGATPRPVEVARAQTLYRATLTADLLTRREVGEMAGWAPDGGIRVVPGSGSGNGPFFSTLAFDFESFEDAADFIRDELVPRLMDGEFDALFENPTMGFATAAPTPDLALAAAAE